MSHVTIDEQTYPLPNDLTFRETDLVKHAFGLLAGEIELACHAGDNAGAGSYALIALRRAFPDVAAYDHVQQILDMPARKVAVDFTEDKKKPGHRPPDESASADDS